MERVLVSACLLGDPVRYDGTAATSDHPVLERWRAEGRIVSCCPEVAAGLFTPRSCVELEGADTEAVLAGRARALARDGADATSSFVAGARVARDLCRSLGVRVAVLKDRSPSCGSRWIHDGTFRGRLAEGQGLTTFLLRQDGVRVFAEDQWEEALRCLQGLEGASCPSLPVIQ